MKKCRDICLKCNLVERNKISLFLGKGGLAEKSKGRIMQRTKARGPPSKRPKLGNINIQDQTLNIYTKNYDYEKFISSNINNYFQM